jgi:hypothetical protein
MAFFRNLSVISHSIHILGKVMGTVIDHLSANHYISVLQDFTDARQGAHRKGEKGLLLEMGLDWEASEIWLDWQRDGIREKMVFRLDARSGPRSGAMREYFELGDYVDPPRPEPERPPVPSITEELITDEDSYESAVERLWALADGGRFEDATAQMSQINSWSDDSGWRCRDLARQFTGLASYYVDDDDDGVYEWFKGWAVNYWHAWGSGATSGGEGAARSPDIAEGKRALATLDARRLQKRGRTS